MNDIENYKEIYTIIANLGGDYKKGFIKVLNKLNQQYKVFFELLTAKQYDDYKFYDLDNIKSETTFRPINPVDTTNIVRPLAQRPMPQPPAQAPVA